MPTFDTRFLIHPAVNVAAMSPSVAVRPLAQPVRPVIAVSPTIVSATNVATANPAILHLQNPAFRPIWHFRPQQRGQIALPTLVSPSNAPTDQTLFEEPQDASRTHVLPLYAIASTAGSAGRQKWVSLAPSDAGFQLAVFLNERPAATGDAQRIAADTRYLITATVQSRVVSWDLTTAADAGGASLKLTLALPDFAGRDLLYQAMTDPAAQARLIVRHALPLALPFGDQPNTYIVRTVTIDTLIPFTFNRDLDANVFAQLGSVAVGPAPQWKTVTVNWNGRGYPYFQSTAQPNLVYFLPDAFKIARQDKTPHTPALSVAVAGDDASSVTLTLAYMAQPTWDPRRIDVAAPALQSLLSLSKPPALAVFQAADSTLLLNLPPAAADRAPELTEQNGVLIDIAAGIQGAVALNLTQFRQVYDALFDGVSQLLSGEVHVTVGQNVSKVPFIARASDFAGSPIDIDSDVDTAHGQLVVTLTNKIESPIHIEDLSGTVVRNGTPIMANLNSITPSLPVDLLPDDGNPRTRSSLKVIFAAAPEQSLIAAGGNLLSGWLSGNKPDAHDIARQTLGNASRAILDDNCSPLFDLSQMRVVPDPKALWHAIMQNQQVGPIIRSISLKAVASMLKPSAQVAADTVMAIQVIFDNGQTVDFDGSQTPDAAGFLTQTIKLAVPVESFVLGNADTRSYRYRVDRITPGGVKTGNTITDNRDVIYLVMG